MTFDDQALEGQTARDFWRQALYWLLAICAVIDLPALLSYYALIVWVFLLPLVGLALLVWVIYWLREFIRWPQEWRGPGFQRVTWLVLAAMSAVLIWLNVAPRWSTIVTNHQEHRTGIYGWPLQTRSVSYIAGENAALYAPGTEPVRLDGQEFWQTQDTGSSPAIGLVIFANFWNSATLITLAALAQEWLLKRLGRLRATASARAS